MIVILAIQALFFADGGLLALGANVWNMAFYGCFVGYFLIYRPLMQGKLLSGKGRTKLVLASILGCVVTLQLGALSVVVETSLSGITALPFGAFAALMQPIHLAIGLVEGGITAAVLLFVYQTRPELLQCASASGAKNRCSRRATLAILAAAALVIGGGLSLLASSNPDGLEWSLFGNEEAGYSANMGLDEEAYGAESAAAEKAAAVQEKTSLLPDYNFAGSDSAAGTSVSGLVGCALVAALAAIISLAGRTARKRSGKSRLQRGKITRTQSKASPEREVARRSRDGEVAANLHPPLSQPCGCQLPFQGGALVPRKKVRSIKISAARSIDGSRSKATSCKFDTYRIRRRVPRRS